VGRNAWRSLPARTGGLLVDAKDYYAAFYSAALRARRSILLAGWQFDRGVKLLRDEDIARARPVGGEVRLLKLLDHLCQTRPELEVYILAWDFHLVFALEREWMQRLYFHWATHERLRFRFDDCHAPGGCHHQKFVVIDGALAFLGGIDLCESRWDDRRHLGRNRSRVSRGRPQKPYHDLQAYFEGPAVAGALTELFRKRWERSGGDPIKLPGRPVAPGSWRGYRPRGALVFPPGPVSISRTDPGRLDRPGPGTTRTRPCYEIRALLEDAIHRAERLIYLETQYFSSRRICEALERRMRARGRSKLDIVLVVNQRAEAVKEEVAVGLRQAENLERLRKVAGETGQALGAYYSVADGRVKKGGRGPKGVPTYIHSKLTIVDDRFLSIGSANLTNRSLDVDTELNVNWEARAGARDLQRAIQAARVSLLAEHSGAAAAARRALGRQTGLVQHLDALVEGGRSRLRALPPPSPGQSRALSVIDPRALPFDPEAECDEDEGVRAHQQSLFRIGMRDLWERVSHQESVVLAAGVPSQARARPRLRLDERKARRYARSP
jgi:phosphatidylserine/phosphatidylglycerophosphate/cardiolipin synthase-like enzyme